MTTKPKIKLAAIGTLVVLGLIIVLQNTESVQTKVLFMEISMPRALLLLVTLCIGFIAGVAGTLIWSHKQRDKKKADSLLGEPAK